ncbi:MAG: hypothetical protein JXB48_08775 [Candidatus Latescibacteria bacterium]|nr:hypothetical protein [Candidatus Latescibacterota bacterium]
MKIRYDIKKMVIRAAVLGLSMILLVGSSYGEGFISREYRPRWYQPYENFGNYDLRRYPEYYQEASTGRQYLSPVTYDQFGNFLLPGGDIYFMKWDRSRVGATATTDASTTSYYNQVFNNLMISSDEFSNWQTKFLIGSSLRAYFTPSTLKKTVFSGIRWDASSRKNNVTLIASPGARSMYGLHWQSILGDILKIGGTFVSQQRGTLSNSHQDIDTNIRTGPRYVYLVVTDDSPEDTENGPRVFDVKVKANGEYINVNSRVFKITDLASRKRYYNGDFQKQYIFTRSSTTPFIPQNVESLAYNQGSWFLSMMSSNTLNDLFSKTDAINYFGYVNLPDPSDPVEDGNSRLFAADKSRGYVEANGTDAIIYEFLIPYATRDLVFDVTAANDYCIDIVAAMYRITQTGEADWNDRPFTPAWNGKWSIQYDAKHVTKAQGNVKDLSNMQTVSARYDRLSGVNVYGLNMELNWRGLFVRAEFNEYNEHRSYPLPETWAGSKNFTETEQAWFVNVEKSFSEGKWSVGGEVFNYPRGYMDQSGASRGYFDGANWSLVDDNDDDDQTAGSTTYEYPGLDADFDRQRDFIWSGSAYPWINYYFDGVAWGDDYNHNGLIDERENDDQDDLPYERDSKGGHYFLKLTPRESSIFTFGHYDIEQEFFEGRNLTSYFKMEHVQRVTSWAEIGVFHRTQRVQDDYKSNQYYRQYFGNTGYFNNLAYKDAWANTSFLHTRLNLVPEWGDLNIINDLKYDVVNRLGDVDFYGTEDQKRRKAPKDIITTSSVHKADYTLRVADYRLIPEVRLGDRRIIKERRIKELKIQPMIKFSNAYFTRDLYYHYLNGHSYTLFPLLRVDYRVAPNTILRLGIRGIPGFPEMRRDSARRLLDKDVRNYLVAFENRSLYQGFNLLVTMGISNTKEEWVESFGRKQPGVTEYFISIRSEASK